MNKQFIVYLYTGILFSNKRGKETMRDSCNNMSECQMYFVKWKKLEPKGILSYDSTYMTILEKAKLWDGRQWFAGVGHRKGLITKRQHTGIFLWWSFLDRDCDGIYSSLHLLKPIEIYITKSELCNLKYVKFYYRFLV